jgi:hypothetical protein
VGEEDLADVAFAKVKKEVAEIDVLVNDGGVTQYNARGNGVIARGYGVPRRRK